MLYHRFTEGLNDKGKLIPETDNPYDYIRGPDRDYYLSTYLYSEGHKATFLATGTIAGITDVTCRKLWWDFDHEGVPARALADARTLVSRLVDTGIDSKDIVISFSGNKGFGVEVNTNQYLIPIQVKEIAFNLAGDLATFDTKVYNASRVLRILGTRHPKTGLYKIPFTREELSSYGMDYILSLAKYSRDDVSEDFRWNAIELSKALFPLSLNEDKVELSPKEDKPKVKNLDNSMKPKFLTSCRWNIQNGNFKEGDRSTALLCLASTYKNLGFDLEHVYRLLKGTAELQARVTNSERFPDEEVYNNIVLQVFSPTWKNGQYSCREKGNWLQTFCSSLEHPCNHKEEDQDKPQGLIDIKDSFKEYVTKIEQNTIVTGIPSIDRSVFLSTGANLGIIGAPGCHVKDTEILMYDGSIKKVQDVCVGDKLMGPDSLPREVLQLRRGRDKMVKIKPFRSSEFIVNQHHILHLTPSRLKQKNRIPGNLNIEVKNYITGVENKSQVMKGYRLLKTGVEFSKKELKIPPYILGLWLGDGNSHNTGLTTMDDEIRNEWLSYADKLNLKCHIYDKPDNRAVTFVLSSKSRKEPNTFLEYLRFYNLRDNKHIPTAYLLSDRRDRLELLAGLIDTDGHCEANKRGWEITQKNKLLASQILFLARSLGFHAKMDGVVKFCWSKGIKVYGNYQRIYISSKDGSVLPVRLPRKKVLHAMQSIEPLHQGFTYEMLPEDDYYGFTLDKDHLYLTGDFIIHHNSGKSSLALNILNNTSKAGVHSVFASLDMHRNRMFEKVLYKISGKSREEIYDLFKNNQEHALMEKLKVEFGNVFFFNKSCPTVEDIRNYVIACQEKSGEKIKLVMLDYFERVSSDYSDDTAASKRVAGELQDLVNDMDVALINLVQPHKHALSGGPDSPIYDYTKIKGSSYVYQSMRIIMSLWRPFYSPQSFQDDKFLQMAVLKNDLGELCEFAFNWNGPAGEISEMEDFQKEEFEAMLQAKKDANKQSNSHGGLNF